MSFLDGLFGAPLDVAPAKLTTSATIAAGQLHLVETGTEPPGSSLTLTIKPGNNTDKAIGIKALSPASEAGAGTITVRPPGGGLIEGDGGLLMSETTMPNEAGQYREWICSRLGNWYLVGGAAGGGGGGETVDEVARAAAAAALSTAAAVDARTSNVTNDAQLKRSAADWTGFPEKSTPVSADMLLLEDSAAGGAKKRASVVNLVAAGGGGGSSWSVAANINPRHWYKAAVNVQSGGLVDQLTDTGRIPKHLTQSGGLRAPLGTDANGKQYLALDGSGKRYTAGVASDWKFLGDGSPWTMCLVMQRTPQQSANVWECIVATMNWSTGSPGMFIGMMRNTAGSAGGPSSFQAIECGVTPFPLTYLSILRPNVTSEIWVLTVVHHGQVLQPGSNGLGWTAFTTPCRSRSASFLMNGVMMAECNSVPNLIYPASDPAGPLTLGTFADGSTPSAARIFELMIEDRALPTDDVHKYAQDTAARYMFSLR